MPTTVIAMNSAELVKAISCPPIWPSVRCCGSGIDGSDRPSPASSCSPLPPYCDLCPGPLATPAARITLRTPAAKPSNRNTIIPHGEIPSHLSSSQPMPAPTRTPATSSVESRKPRASAEDRSSNRNQLRLAGSALVVGEPFAETLEPRGERGLFGCRLPFPSRPRVLACRRPCFDTGVQANQISAVPKAARTIVIGLGELRNRRIAKAY